MMMKKMLLLVLVGILLGAGNHVLVAKKIENVRTAMEIEKMEAIAEIESRTITEQDRLILLVVKAGATDLVVKDDKIEYTLNHCRNVVHEAGYYYEILDLSNN